MKQHHDTQDALKRAALSGDYDFGKLYEYAVRIKYLPRYMRGRYRAADKLVNRKNCEVHMRGFLTEAMQFAQLTPYETRMSSSDTIWTGRGKNNFRVSHTGVSLNSNIVQVHGRAQSNLVTRIFSSSKPLIDSLEDFVRTANGRYAHKDDTIEAILCLDPLTADVVLDRESSEICKLIYPYHYQDKIYHYAHRELAIAVILNNVRDVGYILKTDTTSFFRLKAIVLTDGAIVAKDVTYKTCSTCGSTYINSCPAIHNTAVSPYHSLTRYNRAPVARWKVGIEIEKEDDDMRCEAAHKIRKYGFIKETDGSLNGNIGFEIISDTFDLMGIEVEVALKNIADYVNAKYSKRCGGHIHISDNTQSPRRLYESLAGYFPLLYAMYPSRIKVNYCQAMKASRMASVDKYAAVVARGNTVEFRIFPSPKNLDTLMFRIQLLRYMVLHPEKNPSVVLARMIDPDTGLHKILRTAYTNSKLIEKAMKVANMIRDIEFDKVIITRYLRETCKKTTTTSAIHNQETLMRQIESNGVEADIEVASEAQIALGSMPITTARLQAIHV